MDEEKLKQPVPAPYAPGTGTAEFAPDKAALDRMSYRERLAFKHSDPETYAQLSK